MTDELDETFQGDCSSCSMKLELPREYIGRKVECPGCGNKFIVTDPNAASEPEPEPDAPAAVEPESPPEPEPTPEAEPQAAPPAFTAQKKPAAEKEDKSYKKQRSPRKKSKPVARRTPSGTVDVGTTPDALLSDFKGSGLKKIIVFTLIIHAVVLLGTSVPFFIKSALASDTKDLEKEERIELAVKDATQAIREIAEEYELNPQDISDSFNKGARRPITPDSPDGSEPVNGATTPTTPVNTGPTNAIERELSVSEKGPEAPPIPIEEDDLFK